MTSPKRLFLAAPLLAAALFATAPAHAQWHRYHHGGWGPGGVIAGTVLGLGAAAALGAAIAAPPPPPPVYYAPAPAPVYAPPPVYYAAPPPPPPAYYYRPY